MASATVIGASAVRKTTITCNVAMCEQATGCKGAGDFQAWAAQHGYSHCEVLDWTSSAGNWTFLVSKDGLQWYILSQTNNWPRPGFSYSIDAETRYIGAYDEVIAVLAAAP